jgi:hypothetical protein
MLWLVNPDEEILDWKAVCGRTARTVWREGRLVAFSTPIIIAGSGASVPNILQDIGREDHRILWDDGNLITQFMQRKLANILPIETNGAMRYIIKTQ